MKEGKIGMLIETQKCLLEELVEAKRSTTAKANKAMDEVVWKWSNGC